MKKKDEECGKKSRRDQGDIWWWNEEIKDIIARKEAAFRKLCGFPSKESESQCKRLRNQTRKVVVRAMKKEAEQDLNN